MNSEGLFMRLPSSTYLFYDLETTGLNPAFDQILQFAAVRVDADFNEIERFNIRIALSPDVIPNPNALLVNRISSEQLEQGVSEYDGIKKIHEIVNTPGTISLGYNTLSFDDEFLRFAFFRHLLPPYWHQYKNECHRMDIYPMVLLAYHTRHNLLQWPVINDKVSFKLENLARKNNLSSGQSHDALVDVLDTIALAKLLKANPAFWQKAIQFFDKKWDSEFISTCATRWQIGEVAYTQGFMMASQPSSPLMPVLYLGMHPTYKNQSRWLRLDKVAFSDCSQDNFARQIEVLRKKEGEAPFFFSYDDTNCVSTLDEAQSAIVDSNLLFLRDNPAFFSMIQQYSLNREYENHLNYDANAALYKLPFPTPNEESLFRKFHLIPSDRKLEVLKEFSQLAHRVLAIRLLGRHMPDALSDREKADYENYSQYVFSSKPENALQDHRGEKKLTLTEALAATEKLLLTKMQPDEQSILQALKAWYQKCGILRRRQRESVAEAGFFNLSLQSNDAGNVQTTETNQW